MHTTTQVIGPLFAPWCFDGVDNCKELYLLIATIHTCIKVQQPDVTFLPFIGSHQVLYISVWMCCYIVISSMECLIINLILRDRRIANRRGGYGKMEENLKVGGKS